jgi:hypothetical protein
MSSYQCPHSVCVTYVTVGVVRCLARGGATRLDEWAARCAKNLSSIHIPGPQNIRPSHTERQVQLP